MQPNFQKLIWLWKKDGRFEAEKRQFVDASVAEPPHADGIAVKSVMFSIG
jgi:hypothetical protein